MASSCAHWERGENGEKRIIYSLLRVGSNRTHSTSEMNPWNAMTRRIRWSIWESECCPAAQIYISMLLSQDGHSAKHKRESKSQYKVSVHVNNGREDVERWLFHS